MTTRNQRRNRQLAAARERVRELELEVARLKADLAMLESTARDGECYPGIALGIDSAHAEAQHDLNVRMSRIISALAWPTATFRFDPQLRDTP